MLYFRKRAAYVLFHAIWHQEDGETCCAVDQRGVVVVSASGATRSVGVAPNASAR